MDGASTFSQGSESSQKFLFDTVFLVAPKGAHVKPSLYFLFSCAVGVSLSTQVFLGQSQLQLSPSKDLFQDTSSNTAAQRSLSHGSGTFIL